ncbi:MAG: RNA polymerase sigma factor [Planctomycetota bacterium]
MAEAMSEATLREWMQRLGPRLIALSTGICRDRHRAEEIVQEAFIKLWRKPPDAGEIAFPSWMRRVVTNLSINALQRTKRPSALPEFSSDPALRHEVEPSDALSSDEALTRLDRALAQLDDSKRAILMLRASEGLSYEQIAVHLDVPIGTVMSRLNRARTALKDALDELDQGGAAPTVYPFRKYRQA